MTPPSEISHPNSLPNITETVTLTLPEASGYKSPTGVIPTMADLIVQAAVKDELADQNVSADFYDALDEKVSELLADAAQRADNNDRKTVQPRDL